MRHKTDSDGVIGAGNDGEDPKANSLSLSHIKMAAERIIRR